MTKKESVVKTAEPEPSPEEIQFYLKAMAELIYDVWEEKGEKITVPTKDTV